MITGIFAFGYGVSRFLSSISVFQTHSFFRILTPMGLHSSSVNLVLRWVSLYRFQ